MSSVRTHTAWITAHLSHPPCTCERARVVVLLREHAADGRHVNTPCEARARVPFNETTFGRGSTFNARVPFDRAASRIVIASQTRRRHAAPPLQVVEVASPQRPSLSGPSCKNWSRRKQRRTGMGGNGRPKRGTRRPRGDDPSSQHPTSESQRRAGSRWRVPVAAVPARGLRGDRVTAVREGRGATTVGERRGGDTAPSDGRRHGCAGKTAANAPEGSTPALGAGHRAWRREASAGVALSAHYLTAPAKDACCVMIPPHEMVAPQWRPPPPSAPQGFLRMGCRCRPAVGSPLTGALGAGS